MKNKRYKLWNKVALVKMNWAGLWEDFLFPVDMSIYNTKQHFHC